MKNALQKKLFEKYPDIFRQRELPMTQTCMCWGITCGDGWYWLIDNLCNTIQSYIIDNRKEQIEATQVKEKYGSLRFYVNSADDVVYGMIDLAENLSYQICENCGSTKNIQHTKGWVATLCGNCIKSERKNNAL